ncbi:C-type lectin domain family 2 member A isoform X2 [Myotis daubentonii]|uniref:C-type lectin domain family 2 member A isoform X2 n=1 Tax=Myotis daubentonii TaxID=98922 RepID=UPI002873C3F4|nr:C-type lectin domain family 2 member A isoform X2 [Myotis daubentonii]
MGRNSSHLANVNKDFPRLVRSPFHGHHFGSSCCLTGFFLPVKELALPSSPFCLPASMPPSSHLLGRQCSFPACRMQGFPSVCIPKKTSEHPQVTKCSGKWIGVGDKCFYFSGDTKNWTASKIFCSSQGSELVQIDTPGDMDFLKKHTGTSMHWIGLSRKQGEPWEWTNGTTFNAWFEIDGNGLFAFLNGDGVYSSRGFVDIKWICSKPRF